MPSSIQTALIYFTLAAGMEIANKPATEAGTHATGTTAVGSVLWCVHRQRSCVLGIDAQRMFSGTGSGASRECCSHMPIFKVIMKHPRIS